MIVLHPLVLIVLSEESLNAEAPIRRGSTGSLVCQTPLAKEGARCRHARGLKEDLHIGWDGRDPRIWSRDGRGSFSAVRVSLSGIA